ncbi:MAG TPA: hypothetical protein VFT78_14060 [Hanamia sp.]|jgi:hypothetical protein|nr:hypothetical protein [Hanamia sp.]
MEEKTPEQLKAIEELNKSENFPMWIIYILIVLVFLVFWYLSRSNTGTRSGNSVLNDTTTIVQNLSSFEV